MSFQFPIPPLPKTSRYSPNQLLQLTSNLPDINICIPTVDKVLEAIEHGKADKISKLEWFYCIYAKAQWDQEKSDRSFQTSVSIWKVANSNSFLKHHLLWQIALYYGMQQEHVLANSLAESFDIFANSDLNNQLLPVKIIRALRSIQPGRELARIACEQLVTKKELLNIIQDDLPIWLPLFNTITDHISPCYSTIISPKQQQVSWLLRCLDEMSEEQQIRSVNYLLTNIANNVASSHVQLVEWLRQNYRNASKWYKLSEPARQKLREWINCVNYQDFQQLVEVILEKLQLESKASRQLLKRKEFWSNYSNRFERIRILLPESSENIIGNFLRLSEDIQTLQIDGSDTTEICIFDFGNCFVVEFFRGRGSETRFFEKSDDLNKKLFNSENLSIKYIRSLGGNAHDHVICWQYECEQLLRQKGIFPNEGTQYFKGLSAKYGSYNNNTGLPKPSYDQQEQREDQLRNWKRLILQLEQEAKVYCQNRSC